MAKEKKFCEVCLTETNMVSQKVLSEKKVNPTEISKSSPSGTTTSLIAFAVGLSIISILATFCLMVSVSHRFMQNERAIIYLAENFKSAPTYVDPLITDTTPVFDNCMGLEFNTYYPDAGVCQLMNSDNGKNYISPLGSQPQNMVCPVSGNNSTTPGAPVYNNGNMGQIDGSTATTNSMVSGISPQMQKFHDSLTPKQLADMGMTPTSSGNCHM